MIVTEDMLAQHRTDGLVKLRGSRKDQGISLPEKCFTHSQTLFWNEWHPDGDAGKQSHTGVLVLAFIDYVPTLNPSYEWMALQHQCGGQPCTQVRMVATRLKPRADILPHLNEIVREYYFAETGHFYRGNEHHPQIAKLISSYVSRLVRLNLDCKTYRDLLQEAIYPIDATPPNMNKLSATPVDMSAVVRGTCTHKPVVLLLSNNSD